MDSQSTSLSKGKDNLKLDMVALENAAIKTVTGLQREILVPVSPIPKATIRSGNSVHPLHLKSLYAHKHKEINSLFPLHVLHIKNFIFSRIGFEFPHVVIVTQSMSSMLRKIHTVKRANLNNSTNVFLIFFMGLLYDSDGCCTEVPGQM